MCYSSFIHYYNKLRTGINDNSCNDEYLILYIYLFIITVVLTSRVFNFQCPHQLTLIFYQAHRTNNKSLSHNFSVIKKNNNNIKNTVIINNTINELTATNKVTFLFPSNAYKVKIIRNSFSPLLHDDK